MTVAQRLFSDTLNIFEHFLLVLMFNSQNQLLEINKYCGADKKKENKPKCKYTTQSLFRDEQLGHRVTSQLALTSTFVFVLTSFGRMCNAYAHTLNNNLYCYLVQNVSVSLNNYSLYNSAFKI